MHARRSTVAAVGVVGALVLAGCGQASSSTATTAAAPPTTAGAAVPATASPPAGVPPGLCSTIDAFAAQEQGLASAEENAGGTTGSVTALRQYATRSKGAFDQAAPQITAGLASAPSIVRAAWATVQPDIDRLFSAASTATSLDGFAQTAESIESTNAFTSANQTLSAFAKGACPSATAG